MVRTLKSYLGEKDFGLAILCDIFKPCCQSKDSASTTKARSRRWSNCNPQILPGPEEEGKANRPFQANRQQEKKKLQCYEFRISHQRNFCSSGTHATPSVNNKPLKRLNESRRDGRDHLVTIVRDVWTNERNGQEHCTCETRGHQEEVTMLASRLTRSLGQGVKLRQEIIEGCCRQKRPGEGRLWHQKRGIVLKRTYSPPLVKPEVIAGGAMTIPVTQVRKVKKSNPIALVFVHKTHC